MLGFRNWSGCGLTLSLFSQRVCGALGFEASQPAMETL